MTLSFTRQILMEDWEAQPVKGTCEPCLMTVMDHDRSIVRSSSFTTVFDAFIAGGSDVKETDEAEVMLASDDDGQQEDAVAETDSADLGDDNLYSWPDRSRILGFPAPDASCQHHLGVFVSHDIA